MKKFIIQTNLFFSIVAIIIISFFAVRYIATTRISWKLPQETHILFMGASHIQHGIDEKMYSKSINLASGSERYMFTYLKLQHLLKNNPQIDTIFLQMAPTDINNDTDWKYYTTNEMSNFLPKYFLYFGQEEWEIYQRQIFPKIDKSFFVNTFIPKLIKNGFPRNIHYFGQYVPQTKEFNRLTDKYKKVEHEGYCGHNINHLYLRKIITLVNQYNIKLYGIYLPVFKPEDFYDQNEYYNNYKKNFSDIKLLDYSNLDIPDYYRADEHHLSKKGAEFFTNKLAHDIDSLGIIK